MLSSQDTAVLGFDSFAPVVGVQFRHMPPADARPSSTWVDERRVLEDWLPQLRDPRQRLQAEIDAVEAQMLLLDRDGTIALVNRSWRLSAEVHALDHQRHGVGLNYLNLCHAAAARGCRDAARTAEGIDAVLGGLWRSFSYNYAWNGEHERRVYQVRARRLSEAGAAQYAAVTHELLENHPITAAERETFNRAGAAIES